jgi:CheY-like chemotaxis protein
MSNPESKRRVLVIDDSESIHRDFRRVLCPEPVKGRDELDLLEETLFGAEGSSTPVEGGLEFELDSAFQGEEGLAKVEQALAGGRPYAVTFLDYRMPPGWNGVQTLRHLWKVDPRMPVVFCSAYSDYSWEELRREFGELHRLVELKKPFNGRELRRLALELAALQGDSTTH